MIARSEGGDTGAHFEHLAGALVAADDRELLHVELLGDLRVEDQVSGDKVFVGMAQP